jgi:hypothetical protein
MQTVIIFIEGPSGPARKIGLHVVKTGDSLWGASRCGSETIQGVCRTMKIVKSAIPWGLSVIGVSLILSLLTPKADPLLSFFAYLIFGTLGAVLFFTAWRSIAAAGPPRWVFIAGVVALGLRLAIGVGLALSLPEYGYDTSAPHQTGYLYLDSYQRDIDAWNLARSGESLWTVWNNPDLSDQYGGLLFISAATYRLLSPDVRRPLLIMMLAAVVGTLAVFYTWSFTQRAFGKKAAVFSTWLVALYPEAVLLGASQMREPFLITAFSLALEGYGRVRVGNVKIGSVFVLSGFVLALAISPPYSFILLMMVVLAWVWEGKGRRDWIWIVVGLLGFSAILAIGLTVRAWSTIGGRPDGNIIQLIGWWLASGAKYQLQLRVEESGWVTKMFGMVPEWSQMPLATAYGLIQPFLPAAVMDTTSAPLIRVLVSLRALGWFFLLPFLIASIFAAIRYDGWRSLSMYLVILIWVTAILVSYRDAGRMWDNPRWRTIFLSLQAALAGWTWMTYRNARNPWLCRIGVVVGFASLAFMHWNAGRYYHTPRLNLGKTMMLIGAFTALYLTGSWIYDRYRARKLKA